VWGKAPLSSLDVQKTQGLFICLTLGLGTLLRTWAGLVLWEASAPS
jgi:hypothetical protein